MEQVKERYQTAFLVTYFFGLLLISQNCYAHDDFRDYGENVPECVKEFYFLNHMYQTVDFVLSKKNQYCMLDKMRMGIWDAMRILDTIVDESDPDLSLAQSMHAFQTAERLRKDGHPRWFILIGLIHDLGKVLILFDEPQWAVVGDTFPVGCAYSESVIFSPFFVHNPDRKNAVYQTLCGIYSPHCGLENVHMSWGHDEYLYNVVKDYLPQEASYIIRYHSFYAAHKDGAYDQLMNDYDRSMMPLVHLFSTYDLYSKSTELLDIPAEFFPQMLDW
jgi:inositol oxygenase